MLDSMVFSLNITVPLFLVIALGYLLSRGKILSDGFVQSANQLNFYVTLPALVFSDMAESDIHAVMDGSMILFCALVTTVCFAILWLVAHFAFRNGARTGAFVQGSFRSSAAILGFALMESIYGSTEMMPLMILGAVPLYNIFSVVVLAVEGGDKKQGLLRSLLTALRKTVTNPILIGLALGMLVSYYGISLPAIPTRLIDYMGVLASPLALLTIGANFKFKGLAKSGVAAVSASLVKLVFQAAVFLPLAIALGFRDQKLAAILIMLASPTTPASFVMCKQMGGDADLSGNIVVLTTLLSAVTLTVWLFLLRNFGYLQ